MQTKLDKFGRIVIPKAVRQRFGLKPGQSLQLETSDKEITIQPNSDSAHKPVQSQNNQELQELLLSAPTLTEQEVQEFQRVRDWMSQWHVNDS